MITGIERRYIVILAVTASLLTCLTAVGEQRISRRNPRLPGAGMASSAPGATGAASRPEISAEWDAYRQSISAADDGAALWRLRATLSRLKESATAPDRIAEVNAVLAHLDATLLTWSSARIASYAAALDKADSLADALQLDAAIRADAQVGSNADPIGWADLKKRSADTLNRLREILQRREAQRKLEWRIAAWMLRANDTVSDIASAAIPADISRLNAELADLKQSLDALYPRTPAVLGNDMLKQYRSARDALDARVRAYKTTLGNLAASVELTYIAGESVTARACGSDAMRVTVERVAACCNNTDHAARTFSGAFERLLIASATQYGNTASRAEILDAAHRMNDGIARRAMFAGRLSAWRRIVTAQIRRRPSVFITSGAINAFDLTHAYLRETSKLKDALKSECDAVNDIADAETRTAYRSLIDQFDTLARRVRQDRVIVALGAIHHRLDGLDDVPSGASLSDDVIQQKTARVKKMLAAPWLIDDVNRTDAMTRAYRNTVARWERIVRRIFLDRRLDKTVSDVNARLAAAVSSGTAACDPDALMDMLRAVSRSPIPIRRAPAFWAAVGRVQWTKTFLRLTAALDELASILDAADTGDPESIRKTLAEVERWRRRGPEVFCRKMPAWPALAARIKALTAREKAVTIEKTQRVLLEVKRSLADCSTLGALNAEIERITDGDLHPEYLTESQRLDIVRVTNLLLETRRRLTNDSLASLER